MNNFNLLKKLAHVFHQYGINLAGKKKFDDLYEVHKMDRVFVLGLIYELELVALKNIDDKDAYVVKAPVQIIKLLITR